MLDQETLDDLVSLAKRVGNQVSKRALRAIATREIADAFNDCGIKSVERVNRHEKRLASLPQDAYPVRPMRLGD